MKNRIKWLGCLIFIIFIVGCAQEKSELEATPSPASFPTQTVAPMPTTTVSPTPTEMPTPVPTATVSPTPTEMPTPVPTATVSPTPTEMPTPVPTATVSPTPTEMPTPVPTATVSPTPSNIPTPVPTVILSPISDVTMKDILSNSANYQRGWYKSWGGDFVEGGSSICSRDFVEIGEAEEYYLVINDSRITVAINEYDEDKKMIKYKDSLSDGSRFVKQAATKYIKVTLFSKEWGVDFWSLFELGFELDFSTKPKEDVLETVELETVDFTDASLWYHGDYSRTTGKLALVEGSYAYGLNCMVSDEEYVVHLPQGKYQLKITEMAKDGSVVKTTTLGNGYRWNKQETSEYIAIGISTKSGRDFAIQDVLQTAQGSVLLEKYIPYEHDTMMLELTAHDFADYINVGWNLGNSLDSKSVNRGVDANLKQEMNWGNPYVCKELIDYVADCGFNTIRIPVTWYYNTGINEMGELVIGEQYLERVREVVDYAIANDLYVIINAHHEQPMFYAGVDETEIQAVYKNAKELWWQIAEYFKTYDEHLIFEAYNEVDNLEQSWSYGATAAAQMNELNQIFVDTVRATGGNNKARILIVPTLLDGISAKIRNSFVLPEDIADNRLVVEVHTYSKKFSQVLEPEFTELEQFATTLGAPIIIGEFGTTDSYEPAEWRTVQAANYVARAAAHGIKCIWWDNGSNYAIIDRDNYEASDVAMIRALLDGAAGKMCTLSEGLTINVPGQYLDGMLDTKTGEVVFSHWGTIATESISVQSGTYCMVSLKATDEATDIWLQRIAFYDKTGKVLPLTVKNGVTYSVLELQNLYYMCEVPEGAVTMRISMNSPYTNITRASFDRYLQENMLELAINFFDAEDVSLQ